MTVVAADDQVKSDKAASSNQADKSARPEQAVDKNAAEKKSAAAKTSSTNTVGEPLAPGMMKLLRDEIATGIQNRGIGDRFARFQSYAIGRVSATAGAYTGSELTGNCRLQWYNHLMRDFMAAPAEAEQFTRQLHKAAMRPNDGLARALAIASVKMDAGERKPRAYAVPDSPEKALDLVRQALTGAQVAYNQALSPLSKSEIQELQTYLVPVLSTQNQVGHTIADRSTGRRLCDLMERMDRPAIFATAEALAPLADVRVLEQLKSLPAEGHVNVPGVSGPVAAKIETPSGAIVIGGKGNNVYRLDEMRDVAVVIDLGGNDTYYDGAVGPDRPVLIVLDLSGNDVYRGSAPGIQGAAVLGVSMLVDLSGNDVYQAEDVAQGSALAGVGILVDCAGDDRYTGIRRVQGTAVGGIGILIDRAGKDDYHAAMWAQGVGGPLGFGLLEDVSGNDHYYCGGMWRDSYYPETPGYEGWGQGVGGGIRQVASGGIGVILDGAGDDVYEFDYLAHGGGYWCGLGFARDFGGNDQRLITRTAYDGSPRQYADFQRFGCGWGCHYALGFCFDDAGNDAYEGTIMGTGMAWDCSMGVLCDLAGDDTYKATGGITQGTGAQMGFGILFDYNGNDTYEGYGQGYAAPGISYHQLPGCGGNFAFLVDYGGKDNYGCEADNNCYIQRGDQGGFLIDRPRRDEIGATATAKPAHPSRGS
ncbi:MAG: hypothetical protein LLF97_11975 [Planctomycetaceae bacterium]|nr:hypothetical protein [Planctomycetaceae bacterium]